MLAASSEVRWDVAALRVQPRATLPMHNFSNEAAQGCGGHRPLHIANENT